MESLEERLREVCSLGDLEAVKDLLQQGVKINSQHSINGWSPLHWAVKRGHLDLVKFLLEKGADRNLKSTKAELPCQLTSNPDILVLLGAAPETITVSMDKLPITPNYLTNPVFPYAATNSAANQKPAVRYTANQQTRYNGANVTQSGDGSSSSDFGPVDVDEMVLKVRVAYMKEQDFIEIELNRNQLTYENLITTMCSELSVQQRYVHKLRKLPNTILRKDKDIKRLRDYQEIELVLENRMAGVSSKSYGLPQISMEQIFY